MATSLAAQAQQAQATYAAPGRYYTASPGTSRTILKNFTAPMTPRYYTGGTGGFRSYSRGQQATLRGAGQTASMIGQSLARSAISKAFPGASAGFTNALGLTTATTATKFAGAYGYADKAFTASQTTPTALGATLGKAMPYIAAATSFFTTQGSFGRKAGNALASGVAAYAMASPEPISKAIAVAIMGVQMLVGSLGGKGHRNIGIQAIGLPENAPAILQQQGIGKGPTTLRHYRDFTGHWKDTARPIDAAGALTQQRIGALSRIFPGMRNVGKELAEAKEVMYGPSSSQQAAFGNIQHYVNALYKAEGFMTELFQDPIAQGYIGRKTNMTFEEFEKGFDFASQKVVTTNVKLPDAQKALADASAKAHKIPGGKGTGMPKGPSVFSTAVQSGMPQYEPIARTGRTYGKPRITGYRAVITPRSRGRQAKYGPAISVAEYNAKVKEAEASVTESMFGAQQKQIQEYQDYLVSTPQFGDYTMFRPFEPNWTPGTPQLGLPEDAPGPDIDTLKERLTITDGYYGGMGGGGFPQTRFGVTVPRMSQRGMARQA